MNLEYVKCEMQSNCSNKWAAWVAHLFCIYVFESAWIDRFPIISTSAHCVDKMEILKVKTSKGKECIVINNFKFRKIGQLKNGDLSWRCTVRSCLCRVRTNAAVSDVLSIRHSHNHANLEDRAVEKIVVSSRCKEKAVHEIGAKPQKIIWNVLVETNNLHMQHGDLHDVYKSLYRSRRKVSYFLS